MVHHFPCHPRSLRWKNGDHVSTEDHINTGELTSLTNGDHVSTVDHTNTGELASPTRTTEQLHYQNQQKIVKDEYIYDNFDFLNNSNTPTFTHDYFEYEQGGADIIVKGRLKVSIQFLIDIGAYHFIIDTIRDGYKIPFYSSPPSVYVSNNVSGSMNANFEDTAIQD